MAQLRREQPGTADIDNVAAWLIITILQTFSSDDNNDAAWLC
jgi:hypothetical protein